MNVHVVVEGVVSEKKIYRAWIPFLNPNLSYVDHISLMTNDNFSIVSGGGFPNYFSTIEAAIEDVNSYSNIDKLVIAVDSEDFTYSEKKNEITSFLSHLHCTVGINIIIQHFCIETWALGNQKIMRPNPQSSELREYKKIFNVRLSDPECLPPHKKEELNRAQFAERYLRYALNDKYRNLSYSKSNPEIMLHSKYFKSLCMRYEKTEHIKSFNDFLLAFN